MRPNAPFQPDDLAELDERLFSRAPFVVAMEDVFDGDTAADVIGLRHDVDNLIEPAVAMARWEHERGIRASYYIEHTAPYWHDKTLLRESLEKIAGCGHEIGLHANALAAALTTGRDPVDILADAAEELRSYGHRVRGVVAHGDPLCHAVGFVNDEMFMESRRPQYGAADRVLSHNGHTVRIDPVPRSAFGLEYDPNWLSRADYLSDSGGRWSQPFHEVSVRFPNGLGQLHLLVHPCWWQEAFATMRATA